MLRKEIDARYTQKVMDYISKGYTIRTSAMSGSQGDVAKVDFTDGKEIIRVLLDVEHNWDSDRLVLIVGRCTDKLWGPDSTIWNNRLEVLERQEFYKVDREGNYYVTSEEYPAIRRKQCKRLKNRDNRTNAVELGESAKAIVLPFVRRQEKCKRAKLRDITCVRKSRNRSGKLIFSVDVKGRTFYLH